MTEDKNATREKVGALPRVGKFQLNANNVRSAPPGRHHDSHGLYLLVGSPRLNKRSGVVTSTRSFIYRYMFDGNARELGLGSAYTMSLKQARDARDALYQQIKQRIDPKDARAKEKEAKRVAEAHTKTFREATEAYLDDNVDRWKSAVHAKQVRRSLENHAFPVIGDLSCAVIDRTIVLKLLKPIWREIPETAERVRQRIETVLDYAREHGWRSGENPAQWAGNFETALPRTPRDNNFPALPWPQMPAFMRALRARKGTDARALEWTILTAARAGMTLPAQAREIDFAAKVWTVPAEHVKARKGKGRVHRVPLSSSAMALLPGGDGRPILPHEFLFPGDREGSHLSDKAMLALLGRMSAADDAPKGGWVDEKGRAITTHGMRSCFDSWAAERGFDYELREFALAHKVGTKTSRAYQRGDLLEPRRPMMEAWATFCEHGEREDDNVHPLFEARA